MLPTNPASKDLLNSGTHLKSDVYLDHFYSDLSSLNERRTVVPHVYKSSQSVPMFLLIDHYPSFSLLDCKSVSYPCVRLDVATNHCSRVTAKANLKLTKIDPQSATFKDMLTENGVAYGPLEYAGNGKIARYSATNKV